MFGFTEDVTLGSYVPKREQFVLMLSTLHHDNNLDQESCEKQRDYYIL